MALQQPKTKTLSTDVTILLLNKQRVTLPAGTVLERIPGRKEDWRVANNPNQVISKRQYREKIGVLAGTGRTLEQDAALRKELGIAGINRKAPKPEQPSLFKQVEILIKRVIPQASSRREYYTSERKLLTANEVANFINALPPNVALYVVARGELQSGYAETSTRITPQFNPRVWRTIIPSTFRAELGYVDADYIEEATLGFFQEVDYWNVIFRFPK